jgi:hypothetical protein
MTSILAALKVFRDTFDTYSTREAIKEQLIQIISMSEEESK